MSPLALVLAISLGGAAAPPSEPEKLIVQAEAALADERWGDAGDDFRRAYDRMSPEARRGDLGEHVVTEAVAAYDRAYRQDGDRRHLIHASDVLKAAADDRGGALPSAELRAESDRVAKLLERLGDEPAPEAKAEPATEPTPTAEDRPAEPTRSDKSRRVDGPGVALVTVGAVVLGTGAGLLANGLTLPGRAADRLAVRGGATDDDAAYSDKADRLRTTYAVVGGVAIAIGVAAVVWGAVRLARRGSGRAAAFVPHSGGAGIRVRF